MIIRNLHITTALAVFLLVSCAPFKNSDNSFPDRQRPTTANQTTNPFLSGLSAHELESVKAEALRVYQPNWRRIAARSRYVRQPLIQTLKHNHAPLEFQMVPVVESSYNPYAQSEVGATGLWQLMPDTATDLHIKSNRQFDGRRDIEISTRGAARFLLKQHARFGNWPLAFAAYHLGPSGVQRRIDRHPWHRGDGLHTLPLPPITKTYIRHILGLIALQRDNIISFPEPYSTVTLTLSSPIDLTILHKTSGLPKNQIYKFNPKLKLQQYFDGGKAPLSLRISQRRAQAVKKQLPEKASQDLMITISKDDNLKKISRRYKISVYQLRQANRGFSIKLKPGQKLRIPAKIIGRIAVQKNPLVKSTVKMLAQNH